MDVYVPLGRFPEMTVSIAAATRGDAGALVDALRRRIAQVAPTSAVHWTGTMEAEVRREYAPTRFYAVLVAAFSASALLLTSLGLFALLSHAASRRMSEMGVRLALGATRPHLTWVLVRGLAAPLGAGALAGLAGAAWVSAGIRGLIYDVGRLDPVAFLGALGALVLVAALAGVLPARRVATVDPLTVLKTE
jgi:ABC-type antimicrobial peptide transport system permease subunit